MMHVLAIVAFFNMILYIYEELEKLVNLKKGNRDPEKSN